MQPLADEYLASLTLRGYSPRSVTLYRLALRDFLHHLADTGRDRAQDITEKDLEDYRLALVRRNFAPGSLEVYLRAVRQFFAWLEQNQRLFTNPAAGLVEFASTASYKQYVIDDEIIGMAMRAVRGIEVTDETIALDAYRRVGPGGNFLADPHTILWMRREHYLSKLSNRQLRINWEKAGSPTVEEKAVAAAKRILKDHKPLGLSREINDSLRAQFPGIRP